MIKIVDYGMNGEGVGKLDGKVCLIKNALVGETVEFSTTEDQGRMLFGEASEIVEKSLSRCNPKCKHFSVCGGCDLQHMGYQEQLKFKTGLVKTTLKKITSLELAVEDCVPCDKQFFYRNKCSFNVKNGKIGFFKQNSNDLVEIDFCPLACKRINEILTFFKTRNLKYFKHIVIRHINNQTLIGIVTSKFVDLFEIFNDLSDKFENCGLIQIVNTRNDSVVLSGKVASRFGLEKIENNSLNVTYDVDLLGFHQTNEIIQDKIYRFVIDSISNSDEVVNGYSGQGLLTAILAKKASKVTGVEINQNSHESAERLKRKNKIQNMCNVLGDFVNFAKNNSANVCVLDPAKKGLGKKVCENLDMSKLIYISCNPIALAKDINFLKSKYIIDKVVPFDMFPNTKSVETVVIFERRKNDN